MIKNIYGLIVISLTFCSFIYASDHEKAAVSQKLEESSCWVSTDCFTEVGHSLKDDLTKSQFDKFKQRVEGKFPELEERSFFGTVSASTLYGFGVVGGCKFVHMLNPLFFKTLAGHCFLGVSIPSGVTTVCSMDFQCIIANPYTSPVVGALVCAKLLYDLHKKQRIYPDFLSICKVASYTGLVLAASATILSYGKK